MAREQLLNVKGSNAQNCRACYLLGKSLLDAGTRIRRSEIQELVKSNPSLESWAKWVKEYRAKSAPVEGAKTGFPDQLRDDLLSVVDPESLNKFSPVWIISAIQTFQKVLADKDLSDEARAETLLWMGVALFGPGTLRRFSPRIPKCHRGNWIGTPRTGGPFLPCRGLFSQGCRPSRSKRCELRPRMLGIPRNSTISISAPHNFATCFSINGLGSK